VFRFFLKAVQSLSTLDKAMESII